MTFGSDSESFHQGYDFITKKYNRLPKYNVSVISCTEISSYVTVLTYVRENLKLVIKLNVYTNSNVILLSCFV